MQGPELGGPDHVAGGRDVRGMEAQDVAPPAELVEPHAAHTEAPRVRVAQVGIGDRQLQVGRTQELDHVSADEGRPDQADTPPVVPDRERVERHPGVGLASPGGEEEHALTRQQDGPGRVLGHRDRIGHRGGGHGHSLAPHGLGHLPFDGPGRVGEEPELRRTRHDLVGQGGTAPVADQHLRLAEQCGRPVVVEAGHRLPVEQFSGPLEAGQVVGVEGMGEETVHHGQGDGRPAHGRPDFRACSAARLTRARVTRSGVCL